LSKRQRFLPPWLERALVLGWIGWVSKSIDKLQTQVARLTESRCSVAALDATEKPFTPLHETPSIASPLFPLPPMKREPEEPKHAAREK
jgi:hypothetical protein